MAVLSMVFSPRNQKKQSLKKIKRNYEPTPMQWDPEKKKLTTFHDPINEELRFDDSESQSDYSDPDDDILKIAKKLKDRVV